MKSQLLTFPLVAILAVTITSFLTYKTIGYYHIEEDPPVLGMTTENISLPVSQEEGPVPSFTYNQNLGTVESTDISVNALNNLADYNHRLNQIYRTSLTISLKDGSELSEINLDPTVLRSILKPTIIASNIPPIVNKSFLLSHISTHLTAKQKKYFNAEAAYRNTQKAINQRFMGEPTPQVLGVDDGPTSSGELASKYLEVDLSQQKMYFFINHQLFKEYRVSTGAEYPTPVGEFHILNKAGKAFSAIYNVWMPYWMGFTYARDVGAYLGLHEIVYATLDKKGKPIYRYGYYIGDMMTGGCVAMEPKDSREIYSLSDVGMLVRIVK